MLLLAAYSDIRAAIMGALGPAGRGAAAAIAGAYYTALAAMAMYRVLSTGIGMIEPKTPEYRKRVGFSVPRTLRVPGSIPLPGFRVLQHMCADESAWSALIDQLDRVRDAVAENEKEWYKNHMSALYHTQSFIDENNHHMLSNLIECSSIFRAKFEDINPGWYKDIEYPEMPEMAMIIGELRDEIDGYGFNPSEANLLMYHTRQHSQYWSMINQYLTTAYEIPKSNPFDALVKICEHLKKRSGGLILKGAFGLHSTNANVKKIYRERK